MKIAFVLPNATNRAMGGYKVVYQYANYMAERGHAVAILYDDTRMVKGHGPLLEPALRLQARYYLRTEPRWFALHPSIRKKNIFVMERAELEPYDLVVATAKITADDLRRAGIAPGKVLYLIQDFENWGCSACISSRGPSCRTSPACLTAMGGTGSPMGLPPPTSRPAWRCACWPARCCCGTKAAG